jgi:hypothetical protein
VSIAGFGELEQKCSRAGCGSAATHTVNWRNPRIHTPERIKVWLACDEHVEYLREYLLARDFPVVVAPLGVDVTTLDGEGARA